MRSDPSTMTKGKDMNSSQGCNTGFSMLTTNYNTNSSEVLDTLPPCSLEAEEQILGGLLLDLNAIERIKYLPTEAFYLTAHQRIYRAILQINKAGKTTDLTTLKDWLEDKKQLANVGGVAKIAQLAERTISAANIDNHANLIIDKWMRRRAIELGQKIQQAAYESPASTDELLNGLEEKVKDLLDSPYRGEKVDKDYRKYQNLIEEVRDCELNCKDPGYKAWKMSSIAREYNRTVKTIEDIYFKHLIHTDQEPLMSLDELIEKYGSEVREWLMHGFLRKGSTVLLHAPGGKGKTRLAYNFFYHLATGSHWDGFPVTAPQRKCMIIQADEPGFDMVQAVRDRGFENWMPVLYRTNWQTDHIAYLREEVARERPDAILIDSLTAVNRNSLFTENDAEYARPILLLRDIAQEFNCTIMVIHHSNKGGDARGTGAIFNSVSEVWKLESDPNNESPDSCDRLLTIEKSRSRRPARYQVRFDPEDKSWECLGEHELLERVEEDREVEETLNMKDKILRFLTKNAPTRYEIQELEEELGGTRNTIRKYCIRLNADGAISCTDSKRETNGGKRPKVYFVDWSNDPPNDPSNNSSNDFSDDFTTKEDHCSEDNPETGDELRFSENQSNDLSNDLTNSHWIIANDHKQDETTDEVSTLEDESNDPSNDLTKSSDHSLVDHKSEGLKIGNRVFTPLGKAEIAEKHEPSGQFRVEYFSGDDCWFRPDQISKSKPWGMKDNPSQEEADQLVKDYLETNGESEEMLMAAQLGLGMPAVSQSLKRIGATQTQSDRWNRYWKLKEDN